MVRTATLMAALGCLAFIADISPAHAQVDAWIPQELTADDVRQGRLTPEDRTILPRLEDMTRHDCGSIQGTACWMKAGQTAADVLNVRRHLRIEYSSLLYDRIERRCIEKELEPGDLLGSFRVCLLVIARLPKATVTRAHTPAPVGVTLSGFYSLRTGMSLEEVEEVIGRSDVLSSKVSGNGLTLEIYTWQTKGGGILTASFQNDALNGKSQIGLR